MLLFLALICLGGAAFAAAELMTYPARLKERSIRRAADYGRVKVKATDLDRLHFRARVLAPAATRLAAVPMRLNPRTSLESIQRKLLAAGLSHITPQTFLAFKGAATVGGALLGLSLVGTGAVLAGVVFAPMLGAVGFIAPEYVLT